MFRTHHLGLSSLIGVSAWLLLGCGSSHEDAIPTVPGEPDSGTPITVRAQELQTLSDSMEALSDRSPEQLRAEYPSDFHDDLGYDAETALYLDDILEKSVWTAQDQVRASIKARGFAVAAEQTFASFASGYSEIYMADLPVYVTADMVLEAVFRSHDKILQQLELTKLRPLLDDLLARLRTRLVEEQAAFMPEAASDLNFYLGVALALLHQGKLSSEDPEEVKSFVDAAMKAQGTDEKVLFGVKREIDFSQFKPRGHYAGDKALESYFRAMIWLGRIDLRLIETQSDGSQLLRKRQVEAMLALRALFDEPIYDRYLAFDNAISAFVGEHDYMTLQEVVPFEDALGNPTTLADVDDDTIAQTLIDGQYGAQRVASHIMRKDAPGGTFPLNVSFALLGQRYTVDSHVFSRTVFDRVATRVLPSSLDVAFAALGNNQALSLLGSELEDEPGLAGALSTMRALVDAHDTSYWQSSFYTSWLSALRALSPETSEQEGLPTVAQSEAWGRRLLSTQLASWAQLRHNNVLYVKQSYTSDALCEYPDAYVDPYPAFFLDVVKLAERGQALVQQLAIDGDFGDQISQYFARVAEINTTLADMARLQRAGEPHSAQHLAFINQAVTTNINCDGTVLGHSGWYADLHFDPLQAVERDPVITDVHTDIGGALPVAREPSVMHVGTGDPRLMVVTVNSCSGPRAYAGVVSSFHEFFEPGFTRLTDEEWKDDRVLDAPDVAWMEPVLARD
ncbi:MAG TPA: DUF3160 domain-containing protein [Polyangiaceae bacterium]|nr:DUF3160 domain-containing protein [Polyangiaceae bacterium]